MMADSGAPAQKELSFGAAIIAAYDCVFRRFWRFAKLAAIPFLLSLALFMLETPATHRFPFTGFLFFLLDLVPFAILGVALNRSILTETGGAHQPRPFVGRRIVIYLGYAALLLVFVSIPFLVIDFGALVLAYSGGGPGTRPVSWWYFTAAALPLLLFFYIAARLSLVLPAVSLDRKLGFAGAWGLTLDNSLKLFGVFLSIYLVIVLAGLAGSAAFGEQIVPGIVYGVELWPLLRLALMNNANDTVLASIWSTLVSFVGFGLMTAAFASAYAQLRGSGAPRDELRKRFEQRRKQGAD